MLRGGGQDVKLAADERLRRGKEALLNNFIPQNKHFSSPHMHELLSSKHMHGEVDCSLHYLLRDRVPSNIFIMVTTLCFRRVQLPKCMSKN